MITAVVFDVGETLLDDSREFGAWADWIGVPRHTFSAVLGAVTSEGRNNVEAFEYFRPGFDLERERRLREEAGLGEHIGHEDLYSDVLPTLVALHELDLWVGIAGNQTRRAAQLLRDLALPIDQIATSGELGIAKPDPRFFDHIVQMASGSPEQILYVGDHRDNDIIPAKAAGLRTAAIRRGPWGYLWAEDLSLRRAAEWRLQSLAELPGILADEGPTVPATP